MPPSASAGSPTRVSEVPGYLAERGSGEILVEDATNVLRLVVYDVACAGLVAQSGWNSSVAVVRLARCASFNGIARIALGLDLDLLPSEEDKLEEEVVDIGVDALSNDDDAHVADGWSHLKHIGQVSDQPRSLRDDERVEEPVIEGPEHLGPVGLRAALLAA
ncbi:hypothetical protein AFL94_15700 [Arthrobacter sp. LS16]|nr:hypothetical protein AFL94_15700 [Arthrobacter sp. LS16]